MRNINFSLLSLVFALIASTSQAQTDNYECGTTIPTGFVNNTNYSYSTDPADLENYDPIVYNIYFWAIQHPNGIDYNQTAYTDALQGVANLNKLYNPFGVYFKFYGFEKIQSPTYFYDHDNNPDTPDREWPQGHYVLRNESAYSDMLIWANSNGYKKLDAINVYAFGWAIGFGGITSLLSTSTAARYVQLNASTLSHEIGHCIGALRHTWSAPNSSNGLPYENATRDPNDANYNATAAADRVVDTNAYWSFQNVPGEPDEYPFIDSNCNYTGDETDPVDEPYTITSLDVINTMSDAIPCQNFHLTIGQAIRFRETIAANTHDDNAVTTIESLYEPYEGEYYLIGPSNTKPPLFQPGFDYSFVRCTPNGAYPQPAAFYDTSYSYNINDVLLAKDKDETDFSSIYHPNRSAILIEQLENEYDYLSIPRKCYNNNNRAANDGKVTRFNDGVFNNNVTITPKDSTQINNPTLIPNLPNGLYAIDKNYEDGTTEQTIVQKGN